MRQSILTAIFLAALTVQARATVLIPAELSELASEAQVIARGEVVRVDAQWTDDRRTIETIVTLEAEHYLKGGSGETLQFKVPGGTMGRYRNIVVGAPHFAVGQRVVVFLGANGPRVPHVLGLSQGVYRLGVSTSGLVMVSPPATMPGVTGPLVRGTSSRQPAPLADFERRVSALVGDAR